MSAIEDVDRLIERYQRTLGEFVKGNPEAGKELFSRKDDVTLPTPCALLRVGGMRSQRP